MLAWIVRRLARRLDRESNYWGMETPKRNCVGLHCGDFRMCNDGKVLTPEIGTGLWHGYFPSYQKAREMALSTGRPFQIGTHDFFLFASVKFQQWQEFTFRLRGRTRQCQFS